ncbi:MAG TPA: EAL domain-containing protein [Hyphomicrobiaceae bacterium]
MKLAATIRKISNVSPVAMTQQFAVPDEAPSYNPQYGDAFVVFSVTVLSCAVGAWLLLHLGVALWMTSVAALGVYVALLVFHLLVRRSMMGAMPAPAVRAQRPGARRQPQFVAGAPILRPEAPALPPKIQPPPLPAEPPRGAEPPPPDRRRPTDPFTFRPTREPSLSGSPLSAPPLSAPPLPGFAPKPPPAAGGPRPPMPPAADDQPPEMRVELVQELIKKLADELNTATAPAAAGERAAAAPARAPDPDGMINRSVDALEATARSMQPRRRMKTPTGAPPPPNAGPAGKEGPAWRPTPGSTPGPVRDPAKGATPPQLNPHLARIAEAVATQRMEVLLEPIHGLIEGRPRHFEVTTRLLTPDGAAIDPREYVPAARGCGLMPRIDAAKMVRAARLAGRLGERGREGSVLASITGDSLTDQTFLEAAATGPRGGGMGLVLSFAQSEVRAFTPGHAKALSSLAALGLRFALEEVTDLDMDFAALKGMGFAFVELDAPVFLDGLPAAGGRVPAADICRHLANFGLALIVGRIDDDWLLARILGFGVLYGKGALFGGPRLVKDEVVAATTAA